MKFCTRPLKDNEVHSEDSTMMSFFNRGCKIYHTYGIYISCVTLSYQWLMSAEGTRYQPALHNNDRYASAKQKGTIQYSQSAYT